MSDKWMLILRDRLRPWPKTNAVEDWYGIYGKDEPRKFTLIAVARDIRLLVRYHEWLLLNHRTPRWDFRIQPSKEKHDSLVSQLQDFSITGWPTMEHMFEVIEWLKRTYQRPSEQS